MNRLLQAFIFVFFTICVSFGQHELVMDYNPGEGSSFSSRLTAYLGDKIILTINQPSHGEEIAVIADGELSLLKDILPGEESSDPAQPTAYNDLVYFSAKDSIDTYAVWQTDGTEEGTVLAYKNPEVADRRPVNFVIGGDGALYYSYGTKIFRTTGDEHTMVHDGGSFRFIFSDASYNYSPYDMGVAFARKNSDYSFTIFYIDENGSTELATTVETGFFTDAFGFGEVDNGLMFSISDDDAEGVYVYRKEEQDLIVLPIDSDQKPGRRTVDYSKAKNLIWVGQKGYYLIDGNENNSQLIFESDNNSALQGELIEHAIFNDKMAFVASEGFFGPVNLIWTDGTPNNTKVLTEINTYYTNMIKFGKYGILAESTSNLFDPTIVLIDVENGTSEPIYEFNIDSKDTDSVISIGVQDGYYYFFSNLDESVGRELYRLKVDALVSSVDHVAEDKKVYQISQWGSTVMVKGSTSQSIDVLVYNLSGQLVHKTQAQLNQSFELPLPQGIYVLHVNGNAGSLSQPITIVGQ